MAIRDRDLQANNNDGTYPGIGGRAMKNLISLDPDGFFAVDGQIQVTIPDGPTQSFTFTPDLQGKILLISVTLVKTGGAGGAGDTIQIFNGPNAVTEAMAVPLAQKGILYGAQLDVLQNVFSAQAPMTITRTKVSNGNAACVLYLNVARSP